jgi:hypothetical protein
MMGIVAEDDGFAFSGPGAFQIGNCILRARGGHGEQNSEYNGKVSHMRFTSS